MPRTCTICNHAQRNEIDRALLAGEAFRNIAQRVSVSPTALFRHQQHIPTALAKANDAALVAHGDDLLAQLGELTAEAQRIKQKAEAAGDYRTALAAVRELCRIVELVAKLRGELDERAQHNELHLHMPEDRALRVAEAFIARHGAPKSSAELPGQVIDVELEKPSGPS
jgi:hypothetical protein